MKRRTFLGSTVAAAAGLSLLNTGFISRRAAISRNIGIQLYTLAKPLSDNFNGTIKKLAEFGYKNLEFAGPYYFSPEEEIKNNPLDFFSREFKFYFQFFGYFVYDILRDKYMNFTAPTEVDYLTRFATPKNRGNINIGIDDNF